MVFPGSGWGSGACLPSSLFFLFFRKGICFIMMSWFLLVPAPVQVLVSLLLSLFSFLRNGVLFHHDFLVAGGSGSGAGACVPSSFIFLFSGKWCSVSWFRLGLRCLSPFFSLLSFLRKGVLFQHDLLVPGGSGFGSGGLFPFLSPFLPPFLTLLSLLKKGVCSIMISSFLLVPALVPGLVSLLVSLLVSSFFAQKRYLFHHNFLLLAGSGSGSGACLPSCLFFLCSKKESVPS